MSNLPGNPHAQMLADTEAKTDGKMYAPEVARAIHAAQQIEATMALAYEQRTANLIAYVEKIDDQTLIAERCSEKAHRLGLKTSREMRAEK